MEEALLRAMERGQEWRRLSGGVRAAGALSRTVRPNPPIRRSDSWRKLSGGVKVAARLREAVRPAPLVRTDSWRKPRGVLHVVSAFGKVRDSSRCSCCPHFHKCPRIRALRAGDFEPCRGFCSLPFMV